VSPHCRRLHSAKKTNVTKQNWILQFAECTAIHISVNTYIRYLHRLSRINFVYLLVFPILADYVSASWPPTFFVPPPSSFPDHALFVYSIGRAAGLPHRPGTPPCRGAAKHRTLGRVRGIARRGRGRIASQVFQKVIETPMSPVRAWLGW